MLRSVVAGCALIVLTSCGGIAPGALRLQVKDKIAYGVSPDGAVVVGKERVATIAPDGRVTSQAGAMWAWITADEIKLRGGATIPVKVDKAGNMYLPTDAQRAAGLEPVGLRAGKTGAIVNKSGGSTDLTLLGASSPQQRRIGLFLLLLRGNPGAFK